MPPARTLPRAPMPKPEVGHSSVLAAVLVLALLRVCAQLKVLGTLDGLHALCLAFAALELQNNFLGGFCLLVEDGLGLTAETLLFLLVTAVTLSLAVLLTRFVLRDLVRRVLF